MSGHRCVYQRVCAEPGRGSQVPEGAAPGEGSRSRLPGPGEVPLTCGPWGAIEKAPGDYHMSLDPLLQPLRGPADGLTCR